MIAYIETRAAQDLVEHRLELALFDQILRGEPGWIGRQVWVAPRRRADIVFRSRAGSGYVWVVVEVKAVEAGWDAVAQVAGYVQALALSIDAPIRGILAAPRFNPTLRAARAADPDFPLTLHNCRRLLQRVS